MDQIYLMDNNNILIWIQILIQSSVNYLSTYVKQANCPVVEAFFSSIKKKNLKI